MSIRIRKTISPPLVHLGKLASTIPNSISLAQGSPSYFPNIGFIRESFFDRFTSDYHRYSPDPGIEKLRIEIANKLQVDNKIKADSEDIVITPGANQAFINVLLTITDPGDKIILFSPYYFNHYMACTIFGVKPIILPTKSFLPDMEKLKYVLDHENIKAIVIVNPNNPSGVVYSKKVLENIAEIIDERDLYVISDETYEYFVYNENFHSFASIKGMEKKTITIQSFSKTFGIPGWRLGYYHAQNNIIIESIKVQDTTVITAPTPAQYLGIELIINRNKLIPPFKKYLQNNYNLTKDLIQEIRWMENNSGGAAYYLFPKQNTGTTSEKLAENLLKTVAVHVVPSEPFGMNNHIRISFANVFEENLIEAFSRLKKYNTRL